LNSTACRGRHCRQLGRLCRPNVERPFDFAANVNGTKATRSTLSIFNKVDLVEFNFVASVYRALVFYTHSAITSSEEAKLRYDSSIT